MQTKIQGIRLEGAYSETPIVIVEGSSPEGRLIRATLVADAPTVLLVQQVLTSFGPEALRARLSVTEHPWRCTPPAAGETADGVLHVHVRDAECVRSFCEHLRRALFSADRGEPILEGFPRWQGEGVTIG